MSNGRPLTFSFRTPPQWTWQRVAETWERLDAGTAVQELWLVDHLAARRPEDRRFDAWMALAALAARTRRVRLGLLVSPLTFRHPALFAYSTATVDRVSEGRLNIGLGAGGGLRADDAIVGTESWGPAERVARFAEYVALVDALLRGERDVAGTHYTTRGAVPVRPVQTPRPPFTIAANGPRALRIAARFADRWVSLGGQTDSPDTPPLSLGDAVERTRELGKTLDQMCTAEDRDPRTVSHAIASFGAHSHPYGSDDAFVEFVSAYRGAGIDHFALPLVGEDDPRHVFLEHLIAEVIPQMQAS